MRIALIGQPNCGKSTLFNQVAGYRAETGNFSGTTVTYTETKVRILGEVVGVVDLPGTYSLAGTNPAEREVFNYLAAHPVDVIVNVLDASHLAHGLELTLELMELEYPVVVALNMIDEARREGITINGALLEELLGVPVLPIIASRGQGIRDLFVRALQAARAGKPAARLPFTPGLERAVITLSSQLEGLSKSLPVEAVAIKLLEGDSYYQKKVQKLRPALVALMEELKNSLDAASPQEAIWQISSERHVRATQIAHSVVIQGERRVLLRDLLDNVFLHPILGYAALVLVLFAFFQMVYHFGTLLEEPLMAAFESLENEAGIWLGAGGLGSELLVGLIQGIAGGVAIVLPYLVPFLFGLGLLEDVGYLPRLAFLMDALMHRLGLHGKAIIPFILGYGCNVPAIMSTRILEERRDRVLAAALSTMVPCAARIAVVFGLVAFYVGPNLVLAIYLFNLLVIAITARVLSRMLPEDTPGLILEMPVYRLPTLRSVLAKGWFRIREFVVEAWPILIVGSLVLAFLNFMEWTAPFNQAVRPLSWLLGLPADVGVPLIFGILRKELSLVMLRQALGVGDLSLALSAVQMITFSVFVVFYVPCLATLVVIRKELGTRSMLAIAALTTVIATLASLVARLVAGAFL